MSTDSIEVRATAAGDAPDLETLHGAAFPDEDLLPLVQRLLRKEPGTLSPTVTANDRVAGHIIFTPCGVDHGNDRASGEP